MKFAVTIRRRVIISSLPESRCGYYLFGGLSPGSATATIGAILVSSKFLRLKSILFIAGLLVVASTIIVNFEIAAF